MRNKHNSLSILSGMLAAIISLSVFSFVFASAQTLPTYNAYESFKTATQPTSTPWRYQYATTSGTAISFDNLPWNATDKYWGNVDLGIINTATSDLVTGLPSLYLHSGGQRDPVVTFKAPSSGTIEISMANGGIYAPMNGEAQSYDGVNLYLYKGATLLFSKTGISNKNSNPAENRVFGTSMKISIRKNERLHFLLKANKTTDNDSTYMNPQIKYTAFSNEAAVADIGDSSGADQGITTGGGTDITGVTNAPVSGSSKDGVYRFLDMFSMMTDPWYYFYYNSGIYNPMKFYEDQWNAKDYNSASSIISKGGWHPAPVGVTTLAFKVPKSGKVEIGMESTLILLAPNQSTDGTIITVVSDSKLLCDQIWITPDKPSALFKAIKKDVYAGEMIYFYLSKASSNVGDSTRVEPYIKYLEYKNVAAPTTTTTTATTVTTTATTVTTTAAATTNATATQSTVKSDFPNWIFIIFGAATTIIISAGAFVLIRRKRKSE